MVVGASADNPQYPLVAEWGIDGDEAAKYPQHDWTYSEKTKGWLQAEKDYHNMKAYLLHIGSENDLQLGG